MVCGLLGATLGVVILVGHFTWSQVRYSFLIFWIAGTVAHLYQTSTSNLALGTGFSFSYSLYVSYN
jgi:hypothetical protein